MRFSVLAALVAALLLGLACDRNIEPFVPGEQPRQPDLSRMFPETDGPAGDAVAGAMGAPARTGSMPAPAAEEPGAVADAAGASIRGTIEVAASLQGSEPARATLFVIARRAGASAGPPLAVRRIPQPGFPLAFEIGPQHAMIAGMPFAGDIVLTARLDADGDAMTRTPGDLSGELGAPVQPGAEGVVLVLDAKL
jgi:cytochrome c-type biogenesis protein CcmH